MHLMAFFAFQYSIFRKCVPYARRCAVGRKFEVCWKVIILAYPPVGQNLKSDRLEPISFKLKCQCCQIKGDFCQQFCQFQTQLLDILATSKPPSGQISKIDTPFDAPGPELFTAAPQSKAVRHDWEPTKPFFWKWEQNVTTKRLSTAGFKRPQLLRQTFYSEAQMVLFTWTVREEVRIE